jgi:hypothetical protein
VTARSAVLALLLALATAAPAAAEPRAFLVSGSDSRDAMRATYGIADTQLLPNGDVIILRGGDVQRLGPGGRVRRLVKLRASEGEDVDLLPDGSGLLVVADNHLFRVGLDGTATEITKVSDDDRKQVQAAAPLPDGSMLLAHQNRITRRAPDGTETKLAGNGKLEDEGRPGPALRSGIEYADEVAPVASGGFLYSDSGDLWFVDPAGNQRRIAPRVSFGGVSTIYGDPRGEIVVVGQERGISLVVGDRVTTLVRSQRSAESFPPLWAGGLPARAAPDITGGASRLADGGWIFGTYGGVGLVTGPDGASERLALAIQTETLITAAQGAVRVAATRAATVRVRATAGKQVLADVTAPVDVGTNVIRLPQPLPQGVVQLSVRAVDAGVRARHALRVLGTRYLPDDVARRALREYGDQFGDAVYVGRCRRQGATRLSCPTQVLDDEPEPRRIFTATLRPDGWVWVSGHPVGGSQRVEL